MFEKRVAELISIAGEVEKLYNEISVQPEIKSQSSAVYTNLLDELSNTFKLVRDDELPVVKNQQQEMGNQNVPAEIDPVMDVQNDLSDTNEDHIACRVDPIEEEQKLDDLIGKIQQQTFGCEAQGDECEFSKQSEIIEQQTTTCEAHDEVENIQILEELNMQKTMQQDDLIQDITSVEETQKDQIQTTYEEPKNSLPEPTKIYDSPTFMLLETDTPPEAEGTMVPFSMIIASQKKNPIHKYGAESFITPPATKTFDIISALKKPENPVDKKEIKAVSFSFDADDFPDDLIVAELEKVEKETAEKQKNKETFTPSIDKGTTDQLTATKNRDLIVAELEKVDKESAEKEKDKETINPSVYISKENETADQLNATNKITNQHDEKELRKVYPSQYLKSPYKQRVIPMEAGLDDEDMDLSTFIQHGGMNEG